MTPSNGNRDHRLPHDRIPSTVAPPPRRPEPRPAASGRGPFLDDRRKRILTIAVPVFVGLVGLFLLGRWVMGDRAPIDVGPRASETVRAPGPGEQMPDAPMPGEAMAGGPAVPGDPTMGGAGMAAPGGVQQGGPAAMGGGPGGGMGAAAPMASGGGGGSWPNFRGAGYDNIAQEESGLPTSWPDSGPRKVWSKAMFGPGHAGAAIANGRVYVLDYNQKTRQDVLRCLSLADGSDVWQQPYAVEIKDNHGISRTVPAVGGGYVVSLGPMGHVTCARADSGEIAWRVDLTKTYGTKIPSWYAGQCPIIDDGKAIIAPGGDALMVAIDCASGDVLWEAPNPDRWQMTHASIMPTQIGGRKVYVYTASGGIVGVSASDGKIVFKYPGWTVNTANVPTPVPVGEERLFITGGYGAGSMLLSVKGGSPASVWKIPQNVFGSHQHSPIFYQNHLFGVSMDRQLVCLNLQGKRVWSSGHTATFGIGPYLLADGKILALEDKGTLVMAQASTSGYNELARAKVLPGPDAWAPMALADGMLVLRDRDTMICLDVANP